MEGVEGGGGGGGGWWRGCTGRGGEGGAMAYQLVHLLGLVLLREHVVGEAAEVDCLAQLLGVVRRLPHERVKVLALHRLELAQRHAVHLHNRGTPHA